jgi:hypothetical protein
MNSRQDNTISSQNLIWDSIQIAAHVLNSFILSLTAFDLVSFNTDHIMNFIFA